MAENDSKKPSILENKKLLAVVIIVSAIAISAAVIIQFGNVQIVAFDVPIGVGPEIASEHVHGRLFVFVVDSVIWFDPEKYPQFAFASDYIFLDLNKNIHRTANGATIAMLLDGLGITYTNECLTLNDDFYSFSGRPFEKKAYCNDSENEVSFYVNRVLIPEGGADYIIQDMEKVFVRYAEIGSEI